MNIKKLLGIIALPVGALFLYACGPVENNENNPVELNESAADNWIYANGWFSEWGGCNNAIDDDGDGLRDSHDPDCHVLGPIRDLSLAPFPVGHNYFPNVALDLPGGPGWLGDFRDPAMIARWMRFLTEPAGLVAGIDVYDPGINPAAVPLPAPLPAKVNMGSSAFGNNNNLSARSLHVGFVEHGFLPPPPPPPSVAAAANAPAEPKPADAADTSKRYFSTHKGYDDETKVAKEIGAAYTAQGPGAMKTGSQGANKPARTGNKD